MKKIYKEGQKLEKILNEKSPLFAWPTEDLIENLYDYGVTIDRRDLLKIDRFAYIKKEQTIFCSFYLEKYKKATFTPIENLLFKGNGPFYDKIKNFQLLAKELYQKRMC